MYDTISFWSSNEADSRTINQASSNDASETWRNRSRAILTEQDAIEIYKYKKTNGPKFGFHPMLTGKALAVAEKYHVSPKTIRDIWTRRSWIQETRHLWASDESPKPRRKKIATAHLSASTRKESTTIKLQRLAQPDADFSARIYCNGQRVPLDQDSTSVLQAVAQTDNKSLGCLGLASTTYGVPFDTNDSEKLTTLQTKSSQSTTCETHFMFEVEQHVFQTDDHLFHVWDPSCELNSAPRKGMSTAELAFNDPFHSDWPYW